MFGSNAFPQLFHRLSRERVALPRSDLCQRNQHKITQMQFGVRNMQCRRINYHIIIQKDVQIQRPRSPADLPDAVCLLLDPVENL